VVALAETKIRRGAGTNLEIKEGIVSNNHYLPNQDRSVVALAQTKIRRGAGPNWLE
jgi:hypothetical protein